MSNVSNTASSDVVLRSAKGDYAESGWSDDAVPLPISEPNLPETVPEVVVSSNVTPEKPALASRAPLSLAAPSPDGKDLHQQLSVLRHEYRKKVEATCQLIRRLTSASAGHEVGVNASVPAFAAPAPSVASPLPAVVAAQEARLRELQDRCLELERERDDMRARTEEMTRDNEEAEDALMELWQLVQHVRAAGESFSFCTHCLILTGVH